MYLEYFGLREEPFGATPDPRFLFLGESHREALASLLHGIESGRGFMSLIADPGMGKTTLLSQLLEQTRTNCDSILVFQTQCSRIELLRYLLVDCGVEPCSNDSVTMFSQFNEVLLSTERRNKRFVVIIDEAQNLSDEVLESVRLLSNFERPHSKLLQIILSGQSQFGTTLSTPQQQQLRQRMSMICRLHPLSIDDVQRYIDYRLAVAGRRDPLFTPEAVSLIADLSGGIPRVINNYCFNLLSLAFARRRSTIDDALVIEVARDLDLRFVGVSCGSTPTPSPRSKREQDASVKTRMPRRPRHTNADASVDRFEAQVEVQPARAEPPVRILNTRRSAGDWFSPDSDVLALLRGSSVLPDIKSPIVPEFANANYSPAATARSPSPTQPGPDTFSVAPRNVTNKTFAPPFTLFGGFQRPAWMIATAAMIIFAIVAIATWMRSVSGPNVLASPTAAPAPPIADDRIEGPRETDIHRKRNSSVALHPSTEVGSGKEKAVVITNGRRPAPDEEPAAAAPITLGNTDLPTLAITTSIPRPFQQPVAEQSPATIPARLLQQVAPKYPPRWTGTGDVKLMASIDEHGNVFDVKSEGPPNALLTAAAEAAVYKWRYLPATVNGKPVKSETRIIIRFKKES